MVAQEHHRRSKPARATKMEMFKCVIKACFLVLLFACLGERCNGDPNPGGVFNVNRFGAKPDGNTDNSEAFLSAWKSACSWNGEIARMVIPEGKYLTGPVLFEGPCNNVTKIVVQVKGMVIASTDMSKFTEDTWIVFQRINGLLLTGGGVFNGQGSSAWSENNCQTNSNCKLLPLSLKFMFVSNSTVRRVSSMDSKLFHMFVYKSQNLKFHHIKISAPADSPNTDGINIQLSTNIRISRSEIGTGDDCVAIGHGNSDIHVSKVTCGPGHGVSIGSLGKYSYEVDVSKIRVTNCTFSGTDNGVRIKTWPNSKSSISVSDLIVKNITMIDVMNPILIDQSYCPHTTCSHQVPSSVKIKDVYFEDIRGTSASTSSVSFLCSESNPCQNVRLRNIDLKFNGDGSPTIASCENIQGSASGIQIPPACF